MVCWLCATILKLSPKPSDPSKDEISGKYTALCLFSAHTHTHIYIHIHGPNLEHGPNHIQGILLSSWDDLSTKNLSAKHSIFWKILPTSWLRPLILMRLLAVFPSDDV